jgi:hypothetical protein
MSEAKTPQVPDQLTPYLTDEVMAVHQEWRSKSVADVMQAMPEVTSTEYGQAYVLQPKADYDGTTVVLGLPHQQAMKPSMAIRAQYLQDVVAPDSRIVVLPNNTIGDRDYYHFSDGERTLATGSGDRKSSLQFFYDNRVRLLDTLGVIDGKVNFTGYSLGGLTALGSAVSASQHMEVGVVNVDEAPNLERTPKQLQKDFMASGGWGDQRKAIEDAALPALSEALSPARLLADYGRFALATLIPENNALHAGMSGAEFDQQIASSLSYLRDSFIKVGRIDGGQVADEATFNEYASYVPYRDNPNISFVQYSGKAAHKHPTGDNAVAHALMYVHAVDLAADARI